jgi:phosphoglycolate phosphatase-like HAD superfamily hydrolase
MISDQEIISSPLTYDANNNNNTLPYSGSGELRPLRGLMDFMTWVDNKGLRKAAVTNAPKANSQLMLNALKLDKYFDVSPQKQ